MRLQKRIGLSYEYIHDWVGNNARMGGGKETMELVQEFYIVPVWVSALLSGGIVSRLRSRDVVCRAAFSVMGRSAAAHPADRMSTIQ